MFCDFWSLSLDTGFIYRRCFQEFTYFIFCQGAPSCTTQEDLLGGRRVVQRGGMERLACSFLQASGFWTACKNGQDTSLCLWRILLARKDANGHFPRLYVSWCPRSFSQKSISRRSWIRSVCKETGENPPHTGLRDFLHRTCQSEKAFLFLLLQSASESRWDGCLCWQQGFNAWLPAFFVKTYTHRLSECSSWSWNQTETSGNFSAVPSKYLARIPCHWFSLRL